MAEAKNCIVCWEVYYKRVNCSRKEWAKSTCCSSKCNHVILKQTQLKNAEKRKWVRLTEEQKAKMNYLFKPWHKLSDRKYLDEYRAKWWQPWNKWLKWFRSWEQSNFWKWWAMENRPLKIQIRESRANKKRTKSVLERDNYTCQDCWIRSAKWTGRVNLQAHHKKSFVELLIQHNIQSFVEAMLCKELWDISNWQTLCVDCHKKTESYKYNQFSEMN